MSYTSGFALPVNTNKKKRINDEKQPVTKLDDDLDGGFHFYEFTYLRSKEGY